MDKNKDLPPPRDELPVGEGTMYGAALAMAMATMSPEDHNTLTSVAKTALDRVIAHAGVVGLAQRTVVAGLIAEATALLATDVMLAKDTPIADVSTPAKRFEEGWRGVAKFVTEVFGVIGPRYGQQAYDDEMARRADAENT